jgi:hypothetical protein
MPYTLERHGTILTVRVTEPTPADVPSGLADIQRILDEGGISEVRIRFDEAAWRTGWAECTLTAFEVSMGDLGIPVRVLGPDARLEPSRRAGEATAAGRPDPLPIA